MNNGTNAPILPNLISDVLNHPGQHVDNVFARTWKSLKFNKLIELAGFKKRTGVPVTESVFLLILWKWISSSSISFFSRQSLNSFSDAKKDVMYDLLKREDVDWRGLNSKVAKSVYRENNNQLDELSVYVLDDSIKKRRGKKMEGVSCHFDHTEGRHVMGQQVLTLGLATEKTFLPLDSQIYISSSQAQGLNKEFSDNRSIVAKRYQEATQTKPELSKSMLSRAITQGIKADYLAADAWFGTKPMMKTALSIDVTAILRMKKNKMKYRYCTETGETKALNAKELYQYEVKGEWKKMEGMPYRVVEMNVELEIEAEEEKKTQWISVKLLFVRGVAEDEKENAGKKDWAIFLTTDINMSAEKLLEIYSLRWSIEVYL